MFGVYIGDDVLDDRLQRYLKSCYRRSFFKLLYMITHTVNNTNHPNPDNCSIDYRNSLTQAFNKMSILYIVAVLSEKYHGTLI